MHDVVIVGGGPAGLSAAINARARNKETLVITNDYRESPLYRAERLDNYLGMPGLTGAEFLDICQKHTEEMGVEFQAGRVLTIMPMEGVCYLSVGSQVVEARSVVLATGVSRGKKFPGEAEFLGRGVSYCATCDGMLYRDRSVAVVGMSPDAPEEANYLQSIGCKVVYVSAKSPEGLSTEIPFIKGNRLEIVGGDAVTALKAGEEEVPCDAVFLLRHAIPPTDLLPDLKLENGYISVDRWMKTNLTGIFAAGDCTGFPLQLSKATGEGLVAGQMAADYANTLSRQ